MATQQYTYKNTSYFFDVNKLSMITPNSANVFNFAVDGRLINIVFESYDEGIQWSLDNGLIVNQTMGESAHHCECA